MAQCCLLIAWLAGRSWHCGSRPIRNCGPGIGIIFPWWTPDATTRLTFMVVPALGRRPGRGPANAPGRGDSDPVTGGAVGRERLPRIGPNWGGGLASAARVALPC